MSINRNTSGVLIAAALLSAAPLFAQQKPVAQQQQVEAVAQLQPSGAATTQPTLNRVTGTVRFVPLADGKVRVMARVTGLTANGKHAIHIHEKPDMSSADLNSTGGHFNPTGHPHGAPDEVAHHAGDFGNLVADADGAARLDLTVDGISVGTGKPNDIVGKPVIVHAKEDDLKSQPSGNAGGRIAGGLITLETPANEK